ncbi:hypothetical protein BDV37DRAFT_249566 [Aspergillus pseudonomiae]|uniref:Uncharacterized protein n=1 Tax=Aspergillus pseudonomiae TaxID=1506151 RepID=A0A5N7DD57_9EURO|nr:uncharacterized protein BDV37DRAFT_249566 [Aspergillus pseudonomiae]KAE8403668.1 hypothetical protein BDV37DRAFT_249566 [Aspergillus pseudonomiae]
MVVRQYTVIPAEVEYLWHQVHSWAVHYIPDPSDCVLVQYAIFASIAELKWQWELKMRRDATKNISYEKPDDEHHSLNQKSLLAGLAVYLELAIT